MKKCKYCRTEIDKKAKVCPQCGRSQSNKVVKFIVDVLILLIIFIFLIVACSKNMSDAIDEVDKQKESLQIEKNTVTASKDEYGFSYNIEGYIKNNSNKSFSYVQVTYTTYDKDGNTLGTCMDNNSGLEANGRWKFNAMCLTEIDNIASYKLSEVTGW